MGEIYTRRISDIDMIKRKEKKEDKYFIIMDDANVNNNNDILHRNVLICICIANTYERAYEPYSSIGKRF